MCLQMRSFRFRAQGVSKEYNLKVPDTLPADIYKAGYLKPAPMTALAVIFLETIVDLQLDSLLAIQLMWFGLFGSCADWLVTRV